MMIKKKLVLVIVTVCERFFYISIIYILCVVGQQNEREARGKVLVLRQQNTHLQQDLGK